MTLCCGPVQCRQLLAIVFMAVVAGSSPAARGAGAAVRVAVIGDYGEDSASELAVANLVHGMSPDIVATVGDNSYDSNPIDDNIGKYYARYIGNYAGEYPPGSGVNRFFPSLGNHDYTDGGGLPDYLEYFTLPGAGVQSTNTSGNERYYDFVRGPIHFFVLNSNVQEPRGIDATSLQAQWLRAQLLVSKAPWKIVLMHHAPFSSGDEHGSTKVMQWPYRAWGASAVIAAHDHVYERLVFDGFPYFVNGIGGRSLRSFGTVQPGSVVRYADNYGAMLLTADAAHITFQLFSISSGGALVDTFTLETGSPDLAVSPPGLDFNSAVVGTEVVRTAVVSNRGFGTLSIDSIALAGDNAAEFEMWRAPGALPKRLPGFNTASVGSFALVPGESTHIVVRFTPVSSGQKSAVLRITSSDPDEPTLDVPLTGTAAPPPEAHIVVPATSCDFGGVLAATGVATQPLVVRNGGLAVLSVNEMGVFGTAAADFAITAGGAPFSVEPGDSAVVQLRFAPMTSGTKNATLRIQCNDPQQATLDVPLAGIGIVPSPTRLDVVFQESVDGAATNSMTVSTSRSLAAAAGAVYLAAVTSRDPVSVSSVSGLGLVWTRLRAQCGGRQQTELELWVGAGTPSAGAVTARFAQAPSSAVIIVTRYGGVTKLGAMTSANTNGVGGSCSGGSDTDSYSLPLTTTAAGSLVFVAAAVRNRTLTPGTGYTLRDDVHAGSGGWVAGLVTLDRTVATPGSVTVNGTLSQDVDWSLVAVEIVPAVVYPEITVTPAVYDFGAVPVGTHAVASFEIRNDGMANLLVPGVSIQGANAAEFAITSGGTVPVLGPGARHSVDVRFAPAATAPRSALLRIVSDDPDEITLDLPLAGSGVPAIPDIEVTPSALDFGSIPLLDRVARVLQLSNQGNVALHVTQVRVTGTDSLAFTCTGPVVPFSLLPGESTNLEVTFAATTPGAKNATLRLSSEDPDESIRDVALAATALAPLVADIAVTADTLDFGTVAVAASAARILRVYNTGTQDLDVSRIDKLGADSLAFTVEEDAPFTLAPGDSATLVLGFTPTSPGAKTANLRLTSNDPDESPFDILLTGNGAVPAAGRVVFEGSAEGGSAGKTAVTTATTVAAQPGDLVLAAIASKGFVNVTAVSGLGLAWTQVRAQCGGRAQTGVQVWVGSGTPSAGAVTATFANAPTSAVIVVARYSGADPVMPLGTIASANTRGLSGACSGGSDTASFAMSLQSTVNDAMVFAAVAMRSRTVTPGSGYTLREQMYAGPDGSIAGIAVFDQAFGGPGTVSVNGSFDGAVDWAVVAVEIRPSLGIAKQADTAPAAVKEASLTVGHGVGGASGWVELASPLPLPARARLLDVRGRVLRTLFVGVLPAGRTQLPWAAADTGPALPSGVYFVHAEIGAQRFVRKALLLK